MSISILARTWMYTVGFLYILQMLMMLPPLFPQLMPLLYSHFPVKPDSGIYQAWMDTWFFLGLMYGSLGVVLLWAARSPYVYPGLILAVVLLEGVAGTVESGSVLMRGYARPAPWIGWLFEHIALSVSGIFVFLWSHTQHKKMMRLVTQARYVHCIPTPPGSGPKHTHGH